MKAVLSFLLAAALLMTPGILTDAVGLLCLVPAFRGVAKRLLWQRLKRAVQEQRIRMEIHFDEPGGTGKRRTYEVQPRLGSDEDPPPRER